MLARTRNVDTGARPRAARALCPLVAAPLLLVPVTAGAAEAAGVPSLAWLVATVMAFGGLGGFVDGLTTDIPYRVNFGARSFDIGSLGDILTGATTAIAIFTVTDALLGQDGLKNFGVDTRDSLRVIALSVLSGYAGVRLLNPLTRKLVEQISTEKVREAARSFKARADELTINIKDGDRQLYRFDAEKDRLLADKNTARAREFLDGAARSYDIALQLDPMDGEALLGKAKVLRRSAELKEHAGASAEADWDEALALLDRITSNNPRASRAFYNKACYRQIRHKSAEPAADTLRDLKTALELQPALKQRAATDPDFAAVRHTEPFKQLVG